VSNARSAERKDVNVGKREVKHVEGRIGATTIVGVALINFGRQL